MIEFVKKHVILSSVIMFVTGTIGLILSREHLASFWGWVGSKLAPAWDLLFDTSQVDNRFLVVLSLVALSGLVSIFRQTSILFGPWRYTAFTCMAHKGNLWTWKWVGRAISEVHIVCAYPGCGRRKIPIGPSGTVSCFACSNSVTDELQEDRIFICNEVFYRLKTGTWKELVKDPWKFDPEGFKKLQREIKVRAGIDTRKKRTLSK